MKAKIHPTYHDVQVNCSCGAAFTIRSAYEKDHMQLEICSNCHPFYTGQQKMIDTAGRLERFQKKFGRSRFDRQKNKAEANTAKKSDDNQ